MKSRLFLGVAGIIALLLSLVGGLGAAPAPDEQNYAPDRILVSFQPGTPEKARADIHARHGGKVEETIAGIGVQVVRVPENKVAEKVRAYKGEGSVAFAEPDYVARAIFTPDDSRFSEQWGMRKIEADKAWNVTQGSASIRIAICDTGIDASHVDLAGKVVDSWNFTSASITDVDDGNGHGTHVAGIAAAATNNGKGVAGVGFDSSLMNAKVLGDDGSGYYSWVANGIIWAANNGAKVINLSLGGPAPSSALKYAVDYAWNKGSVLVAAAGNSGNKSPSYPAYYTNCIAVAATDSNDAKAWFSNYGKWVDIAAPGVGILSTMPGNQYASWSGTSMASPYVAGVAALVWSTGYGTSASSVRMRIEGTADKTGTIWSTYRIKRVNAFKSVQ